MTVCKNPAALMSLVEQADNIVALTGAGLSTAAGIPDFRGPEPGCPAPGVSAPTSSIVPPHSTAVPR